MCSLVEEETVEDTAFSSEVGMAGVTPVCIRKDKVKIKTHETDEGSYLPSSCLCWVVLGPDGGETSEVVIDCENELNVAEGSAVV